MKPASLLPLAANVSFTQPRNNYNALQCTCERLRLCWKVINDNTFFDSWESSLLRIDQSVAAPHVTCATKDEKTEQMMIVWTCYILQWLVLYYLENRRARNIAGS